MTHIVHSIGVAARIGAYSDAIEIAPGARWLFTAGTPGLSPAGDLPGDIVGQAGIAWGHIVGVLARAGMGVGDLVKVTHYLLRPDDVPAYVEVRARFLGAARPASMLLIVPQLVRPAFLVEIEAVAARTEPDGNFPDPRGLTRARPNPWAWD